MSEEISKVDMVIYVLDARAPFSCLNPEFKTVAAGKPILYVINKADLVEESKLFSVKNNLIKQNDLYDCVILNSTSSGANKQIEPIMRKLCDAKITKYKNKGIKVNLRAMVIGVPNSGKSTLINNLCGVKKAITGDKAGVTRGRQWVSLKNGFELLDTPGTLWPNLENKKVAQNLAYIGSIRNEVLDINELALEFVCAVRIDYKTYLENRYKINIDDEKTNLEILDEIAEKSHFLLKGNEIDYDRVCFTIIDDFRKGRLGKIFLDNEGGKCLSLKININKMGISLLQV